MGALGIRGKYALGCRTGLLTGALAANSDLFHFRWSNSSGRLAAIRRLRVNITLDTAVYATTFAVLGLGVYGAAMTGSATGNNTDVDPGAGCKRFPYWPGNSTTAMPDSLIAANDIQVCTTAGMTYGAAPTLNAQPLAVLQGCASNAHNAQPLVLTTVLEPLAGEDYAVVLAQNQGIVIENLNQFGTTGTCKISFNVEWDEVTGF